MKAKSFNLVLLALAIVLAGCGSTSLKYGWHESSSRAHKSARYETFDGLEKATIRAAAGQTLTLDYDLEVNKGALTLAVDGPDGTPLWQRTFHEDAADIMTLTTPAGGTCFLRILGDDTGGSFDLSWQTAGESGGGDGGHDG